MEILNNIFGFILAIGILVAFHEFGHYWVARRLGVKVLRYSIGFGKPLLSWRRGRDQVEYVIAAIPLGGYVKLVGMYPPEKDTGRVRNTGSSANPLATMIESSREAEWADITAEDDGRLFYQKKTWQKLIIMAGGPTMNLILAFLILWGVLGIHGSYRPQPVVQGISECVVPADRPDRDICLPGDPPTPAVESGLEPGDRIVSFNAVPITDWKQLQNIIRDNGAGRAEIVVDRDEQNLALTPVNTVLTGVADTWDPAKRVEAGFLGFTPTTQRVHAGPLMVLQDMGDMTRMSAVALAQFPVKVWNTAANLVTGQPRDIYGPMSVVGASRAAGEISTTTQLTAADKVATFLVLLGNVNLFVALFNFVPLLPLDGGHIVGAIAEWVRRQLARLFRRPDPGYLDTAKMMPVAYVVFVFIAVSGIVLILADLIDPVRLF